MREYRLLKLGMSMAEIDAASAVRCDYLLAVEDAVLAGQRAAEKAAEVRR